MTLFIPSSPYFTGYDSAVEKRIFYMLEKSIQFRAQFVGLLENQTVDIDIEEGMPYHSWVTNWISFPLTSNTCLGFRTCLCPNCGR
jgi:hypothetical protein